MCCGCVQRTEIVEGRARSFSPYLRRSQSLLFFVFVGCSAAAIGLDLDATKVIAWRQVAGVKMTIAQRGEWQEMHCAELEWNVYWGRTVKYVRF